MFAEDSHPGILQRWQQMSPSKQECLKQRHHAAQVSDRKADTPWEHLLHSGSISDRDLELASNVLNEHVLEKAESTAELHSAWLSVERMDERGTHLKLSLRTYAAFIKYFAAIPKSRQRAFDVYERARKHYNSADRATNEDWRELWYAYMAAAATSPENAGGHSGASRALQLLKELDSDPPPWFKVDNALLSSAMQAVARGGNFTAAQALQERLQAEGLPGTHAAYAVLVRAFGQGGETGGAVRALVSMMTSGHRPEDSVVLECLGNACANDDADSALQLLRIAVNLECSALGSAEIEKVFDCAARAGSPELAQEAYQALQPLGLEHSDVMLNCIACAYANCDRDMDALGALGQIVAAGGVVDPRTIGVIAKRLSQSVNRVDEAYYMLAQVKTESNQAIPVEAVNAVILACCRMGDPDRALSTADAVERVFGLRKDVNTYNYMLRAVASINPSAAPQGEDGSGSSSDSRGRPSRKRHVRTKDTRAAVALQIVSDMRAAGVPPDAESYFSLIQLVQIAGSPQAMHDTLKAMKEEGVELTREMLQRVVTAFAAWMVSAEAAPYREQLAALDAATAKERARLHMVQRRQQQQQEAYNRSISGGDHGHQKGRGGDPHKSHRPHPSSSSSGRPSREGGSSHGGRQQHSGRQPQQQQQQRN